MDVLNLIGRNELLFNNDISANETDLKNIVSSSKVVLLTPYNSPLFRIILKIDRSDFCTFSKMIKLMLIVIVFSRFLSVK